MTDFKIKKDHKNTKVVEDKKRKILKKIKKVTEQNKIAKSKDLSLEQIKNNEIKRMKQLDTHENAKPSAIPPHLEQILFVYYHMGLSLQKIHELYGKEMKFNYRTLIYARDFYKWNERSNLIQNLVYNDQSEYISRRHKDYIMFLDSIISESMARFKENLITGRNKNPLNTFKITNMRDLKEILKAWLELLNLGKNKHEISINGEINHNHDVKLTSSKAEKILDVLAESDDD